MSWWKVAGLYAWGALCLVVGVLMLADGESFGVGIVAFGVASVAAGLIYTKPDAPEEPVRPGTVPLGAGSLEGLLIRFSRRRAWLGVVIGVGFTVMGVFIALDGELLVGIGCAALFGVMTVLGLVGAAGGGGTLVLGEETIAHVGRLGATIMRWEDVTLIREYDIRGNPFLALDGVAEHHGIALMLAPLTRRYGAMSIGYTAVGVDPDWLEALIRRCVEDPAARREIARGAVPPH